MSPYGIFQAGKMYFSTSTYENYALFPPISTAFTNGFGLFQQ